MRLIRFVTTWRVWAVALAGLVAGCQGSPEQRIKDAFRQEYRENGRRLAVMYGRFMSSPSRPVPAQKYIGPRDENEFRSFMATISSAALAEMGIGDVQSRELFCSERDGRPFRVRYGVCGPSSGGYAVLCETTGVAGRVKVFRTDGFSCEVPAAEAEAYIRGERDAQEQSSSAE